MFDYFKLSKFFLLLPLIGIVIVSTTTLFPYIVGKYVFFRATVDISLILFLLGFLASPQMQEYAEHIKKIIRHPLVIAVTLFVIAFLLASLFGVDPAYSFWSNFERGEGGIQIVHLYIFFLLLAILFKDERDWNRVFAWALSGAFFMAVYGFFASAGVHGFIGAQFSEGVGYRFQGSIGNPSYVAAYLIFSLFYILYLLRTKYYKKLKSAGAIFLLILAAFFLVVFYLAETRGAFMGLLIAGVAFLSYRAVSYAPLRKWFFIIAAVLIIVVGGLVYFKNTAVVKSLPGSRLFDISFSATTFQHRAIMWKTALDGFKERPVFGWGPENFIQVFDRHFNTAYYEPPGDFGAWFDRAHSIYFDYLVETGALGLLTYVGIFVVLYWQIFRMRISETQENAGIMKFRKAWLFALPLAYLVQGIVLFDVFPMYLNNFLFFAFAVYLLTRGAHPLPYEQKH